MKAMAKRKTFMQFFKSIKAALLIAATLSCQIAFADQGFSGLTLNDNSMVESVIPYSPAHRAGILRGDRIESINGTPTAGKQSQQVRELIIGPAGAKVSVVILRGSRRYGCEFTREVEQAGSTKTISSQSSSVPTTARPATTEKAEIVVPVEIFRRTQYTDKTEQQVRTAIAKVPKRVQESVKSAGITIFIVPDMLSAHPELNIEKPRGYHGGGYDNCGGMFSPGPKKIYICERVSWRNSPLQENWHLPATSLHEMGHAYDHTGSYSKAEEFVKAYEDDGKYLGSEQRRTWEYFLQENDAGRSEMFAELFVATISPSDNKRAAGLSQAFPRCTKYVQGLLGK
ncbi:MAG: hypothetical protein DKT66_26390 [Candidatus Melainabacteria bacterium]|nr:MAG: hypothetical protein DKT66_26390 [Candidatus Melainabacteria bacterium]